jgi:class 3 adenylate cyclase
MSGAPGPKVQRHLAAIFAADVEGYSRLMGVDEVGTLQTLTAHREIMDRLIGEHGAGLLTRLETASWRSSRAS